MGRPGWGQPLLRLGQRQHNPIPAGVARCHQVELHHPTAPLKLPSAHMASARLGCLNWTGQTTTHRAAQGPCSCAPPSYPRLLLRVSLRSLGFCFHAGCRTAARPLCCASSCWLGTCQVSWLYSGAKGSTAAAASSSSEAFILTACLPRALTFCRNTSSRSTRSSCVRPPCAAAEQSGQSGRAR